MRLGAGAGLLLLLSACCAPEEPTLEDTLAFYRTRPAEEQPKAWHQATPAGLSDLRASTCGGCHREIYEEWRVSTHGLAWVDPQFQREIQKSENRWLCNNCHTPLMNQMERWATGLEGDDVERPAYIANPAFDPAFRDEGITCAACHVRDGVVEGPTGAPTPAHPTRRHERFLTAAICLECHQAVREYPGKTFVCTFTTGEEWRAGPFGRAEIPCQHCHMPEIERPWAEGSPPRKGRRHYWPGAGIYKFADKGPPLDLLPPGLSLGAEPSAEGLTLRLTNTAGHRLPTGDPERYIAITTIFAGADGAELGREELRLGQRWEWWPTPRKLADDRLAPGETREVALQRPPGAARWSVEAWSHRINAEAVAYHGLEGYPAARMTQRLEGAFAAPEPPTPTPALEPAPR